MLGKNLDEELIDGVVVAKRVKGLLAKLVVAKSNEEILRAAGNRWSVLPYTTKLRETLQSESINRVTIVGLPCQTQFLQQMKTFPLLETDFVTKIYLIVSLFCIGTFATEPFIEFLKLRYGLDPERVTYIGLEKNSIRIEYDHEQKLVPPKRGVAICTNRVLGVPRLHRGVLRHIGWAQRELPRLHRAHCTERESHETH